MAFDLDFFGEFLETSFYPEQPWAPAPVGVSPHLDKRSGTQGAKDGSLNAPKSTDPLRRRKRTTFSRSQVAELERTFCMTQYPDSKTKLSLAMRTGLPETKIQVWFQNRRARYFKSKKKSREVQRAQTHPYLSYQTGSPPFFHPAPAFPATSSPGSLLSGYPAMCAPQAALQSAPVLHQQLPDFAQYFQDGFDDLGRITEDLQAFLQPAAHPQEVEPRQGERSHSGTEDSLDDLSDLCFKDLCDFNLSDLDLSAAMIDYLMD
ncbi:paired mesoderm homeobox protein 1-like [Synchiropus splendidus]|uniref:paired mesoderm homeobox protein 1-like n=1 Tax=Synchiropus splendidus TaxID=270530 RepID=UPI00237E66FD|nr:paired mesoderm homeobox protein 1-like [Synchiropus splendidus]XP_053702402.1 paired mesoderm homeobox protein 1-like [Synchiropus splendidus]